MITIIMLIISSSIAVIIIVYVSVNIDAEAVKDALVRQLYYPVRWTETIERVAAMPIEQAFEVGPGKVLTGLNKRITKNFSCIALNSVDAINAL